MIKMMAKIIERIFHRKELRKLRLMREKFLSGDEVHLSQLEKKMIFDALYTPEFKNKVQSPSTKYLVRQIYLNLKTKIAASIKEMG